jgi:adenosylhomocysteine nucleosidase
MSKPRLAIMTAMPEEASMLLARLAPGAARIEHGRREFHIGTLHGSPVALVVARCGKVSAAATTTELIVRFGVDAVVCTGVAGGLGEGVAIGDIVVADRLVQHDLDPRPLWPRHVVPLLERSEFHADPGWTDRLEVAARRFEAGGRVHRGLIASGDQFIHGEHAGHALRDLLPGVLCVEMEGAAVAQVCCEYAIPCAVVRVISDRADSDAPADFGVSLGSFAAGHTAGIIESLLRGS